MKLQLAFRNIFRNRRRTLLNVIMIAGGISAIVIFRGFCNHLIWKVQEIAINSQYGHLQIASLKTWDINPKDPPRDRLINLEPSFLLKIKNMPEVAYISGRISFYGLLSSGDYSVSARGIAFDPAVEKQMQSSIRIVEGKSLDPNGKFQILLGSGLQKQLGTPVGTSVSLVAYTYDGSINAVDSEIVGIFQTELAEVDNTTFFIPLATSQRLLDTDSVERIIVQLNDTKNTDQMKARINADLPSELRTKAWSELATIYLQVVDYFRVQNLIIEWILMVLVLLSIVNTVGMSVTERTGEIGMLRAMGDTRRDIIVQFMLEGLVLGVIGGVIGCITAINLAHLVTSLHIPILTPNSSVPQLIEVDLILNAFVEAFLMTCFVAVLASLIPAYRASRLKIVDALKHNT